MASRLALRSLRSAGESALFDRLEGLEGFGTGREGWNGEGGIRNGQEMDMG
jgi:hypothetical protein